MRFGVKLAIALILASILVIIFSFKHLFRSYSDFLFVFFVLILGIFFVIYFAVKAKILPDVEYSRADTQTIKETEAELPYEEEPQEELADEFENAPIIAEKPTITEEKKMKQRSNKNKKMSQKNKKKNK